MTLKTLLLGSAAAFSIVSGAQAADAIVAAAPEPMEYVKVCDAFGAGYFYIPGSETCLKIGGYARYQVAFANKTGQSDWYQSSRFRLEATAKNDSELGTVSSFIRIERNDNTLGTSGSYTARYKVGIAGFEAGYADPKWDGIGGGFTDWGGTYENTVDPSTFASYTANLGAVTLWGEVTSPNATTVGKANKPGLDGAISYTMGDYTGLVAVGYDFQSKSTSVIGKIQGKVEALGFIVEGLYGNKNTSSYFNYKGWSAIGGLSLDITDKVAIMGDVQWWDDHAWKIGGDVSWKVANGFTALGEVTYGKGTNTQNVDKQTTGFLRLTRNF